jgi:multicomponent Na+:H+ antiporter subunit C
MESLMAVLVGFLFGAGVYMMLANSRVRLLIGILLISSSVNILIFVAGGLTKARPALIPKYDKVLQPPYADPLPQALILTALVIGFALFAFTLVLVHREFESTQDKIEKSG